MTAKVILVCGKLCSGKSTYTERLRRQERAAVLSVDEIMLAVFGQHCGERHEEYGRRIEQYLLKKSLEFLEAGMDVILDWGFWRKEKREAVRRFYRERQIRWELHYIDICEEEWKKRLEKRNRAVAEGKASAYFVDGNLARKFEERFEKPEEDEVDVWVRQ